MTILLYFDMCYVIKYTSHVLINPITAINEPVLLEDVHTLHAEHWFL